MTQVFGIDVGGTGIKGAIIDVTTGEFLTEKIKIATPQPATPKAILDTIGKIKEELNWNGDTTGIGFPATIKNGAPTTANNIDSSCIGFNFEEALYRRFGQKATIINDADAAGLGEYRFGTHPKDGVFLLLTIGTGTGAALLKDGVLIPNLEVSFMEWKGNMLDKYASNKTRKDLKLDWETWGLRLNEIVNHMNMVFSPNQIILGGGVSKHFEKYAKYFDVDADVKAATLQNNAGIIGAAYYAWEHYRR